MNTFTLRQFALGFILLPVLLTSAAAEPSPRDELLRLIPDDAAFCIIVQDLRSHSEALAQSPFLEHLQKTPFGQIVAGTAEMKRLADFQNKFQGAFNLDFGKVRDDILGDAVVFSYRPAVKESGQTEQELFLVRARDPKVLADFLEQINKIQKASGDLKEIDSREHGGQKYVRRVEKQGENFVYINGPLLVMTSKEEALKEAIDRDRNPDEKKPKLAGTLHGLGVDRSLAVVWVNPRAFDPLVAASVAEAKDSQVAALKTFQQCWKAIDGAALSLDFDKDLRLSLSVQARVDQMPLGIRQFLGEAARPSDFWKHVPDNAMIAFAGRTSPSALLEALGEFLNVEDRKALVDGLERSLGAALGQSAVQDILPNVGPDWGICVTAPSKGEKGWFPHVVAGVRVNPGQKTPAVDRALWSTLDSYALLAVLDYNRQNKDQLTLKTSMQGKLEVKSLVNEKVFPPGLQPSYALTDGYLVLASSPEAVRRFAVTSSAVPAGAEEVPLLKVSPPAVIQFLQDRREELTAAIAEKNQTSKVEAAARLDGLLLALPLVDRVEVFQKPGQEQMRMTVRVQLAQPLRR